ncbi:hypothetical protein DAEQUDRAFT_755836 [Daedalea quercina L-15889]|uniref:Uncharacterized protein n=1 Tax=Daedalea quercina L-15889 TaxID=1314783 RepID=A0A165RZ56_9APHY|nr:hypothetical protein DAEQUDRAFT_755836 [Daedalea quercina L-15889]
MRFGTTFSLLCAAAVAVPAALAMPFDADALESRAFDAEIADLVARSHFESVTSLVARAIVDMLEARANDDPPNYKKHDPNNGPKPKYSKVDPRPRPNVENPPKYRQKDPNPPGGHPSQQKKGSSSGGRKREFYDYLW